MFRQPFPVSSIVMLLTASVFAVSAASAQQVTKHGLSLDIRSHGRAIADDVAAHETTAGTDEVSPVPGVKVVPQIQLRGPNVQVNDASLDNIQIVSGSRPFVAFTQSETSVAAFGNHIVVTYNTTANQPLSATPPPLHFVHRFLSGFSNSTDGGKTWTSGFMPPVPGSIFTFGDGVVDVDRHGNFYFAGLGADPLGRSTIQSNNSTDGGITWGDAVVIQQDNGGDKEWIAVGKDPSFPSRDNVYVTWTSFQATGAQLRFGRSIDGGVTWTTKTIFAPGADPDPTHPQNALHFSNPSVDPFTGSLYIPFLHFSNADADFVRILISDDAGDTFHFATFNVPGAPDPTLLPVVAPGEFTDCGTDGGVRLVIHEGSPAAGRFGLRRFVQASRLIVQPAFAARNGVLYLAWSNSTSPLVGDPNGHSNVLFVRSNDGGSSWTAPIQVNPAISTYIHHVLPSLAIDQDPNDVHVAFYTQHGDGTVDVDMANSHDRGNTFPDDRAVRLTGTSFHLAPTNIPLTGSTSTNYDRTSPACYCLGEYLSVRTANGKVYAAWGDGRNVVTEPVNALDPLSGQTHAQEDVFFQSVKAQ